MDFIIDMPLPLTRQQAEIRMMLLREDFEKFAKSCAEDLEIETMPDQFKQWSALNALDFSHFIVGKLEHVSELLCIATGRKKVLDLMISGTAETDPELTDYFLFLTAPDNYMTHPDSDFNLFFNYMQAMYAVGQDLIRLSVGRKSD